MAPKKRTSPPSPKPKPKPKVKASPKPRSISAAGKAKAKAQAVGKPQPAPKPQSSRKRNNLDESLPTEVNPAAVRFWNNFTGQGQGQEQTDSGGGENANDQPAASDRDPAGVRFWQDFAARTRAQSQASPDDTATATRAAQPPEPEPSISVAQPVQPAQTPSDDNATRPAQPAAQSVQPTQTQAEPGLDSQVDSQASQVVSIPLSEGEEVMYVNALDEALQNGTAETQIDSDSHVLPELGLEPTHLEPTPAPMDLTQATMTEPPLAPTLPGPVHSEAKAPQAPAPEMSESASASTEMNQSMSMSEQTPPVPEPEQTSSVPEHEQTSSVLVALPLPTPDQAQTLPSQAVAHEAKPNVSIHNQGSPHPSPTAPPTMCHDHIDIDKSRQSLEPVPEPELSQVPAPQSSTASSRTKRDDTTAADGPSSSHAADRQADTFVSCLVEDCCEL